MKISFKEISIYNIESLQQDILSELKTAKTSFLLDFEEVSRMDLNSIQLLISLKKYCQNNDLSLELKHINARQIKQMFRTLNLNDFLGI